MKRTSHSDAKSRRVSAGVGGTLALEFANTAGWHLSAEPSERLQQWRDFARWAREQGLVHEKVRVAGSEAGRSIAPIISFRETIFRIGLAVAKGAAPASVDLENVLRLGSSPLPAGIWLRGRLHWQPDPANAADQMLGLIARDALDLLASERAARLKICEGGECGWLFLDESRGRPRRWCSMSDCGNRAKASSAYRRAKLRLDAKPAADRITLSDNDFKRSSPQSF